MKVALVYDRVNKWGGAERVLLALHELFPDAPLYTSVYNKKTATWAKPFTVKTSFLQHIPYASSAHEYFPMLMPMAFESFSFDQYDVVISVSSEAAKGVKTGKNTLHICYCLTPTRYLWSGYKDYFKNRLFKTLVYPLVWSLRVWDKNAARRPDIFVAISDEIRKRIKTYYKRESVVIYPPVSFGQKEKRKTRISEEKDGYFLVVSRLVGYKRIDLAIQACNMLQLPLKIIGIGVEEKNLKSLAGSTVEFLGLLTEQSLVQYYKGCKALLFPGIEDFGLTVVEAQSFGKPVIAFAGGGALETIKKNKTGIFFTPQTVTGLVKALRQFNQKKFSSKESVKNAQNFSKKRFKEEFIKIINKVGKERGIHI